MRRPALYSSSRPARASSASPEAPLSAAGDPQPEAGAAAAPAPRRRRFALSPSSPALLLGGHPDAGRSLLTTSMDLGCAPASAG